MIVPLGSGGIKAGALLSPSRACSWFPHSTLETRLTCRFMGNSPRVPKFFLPLDDVIHIHSLLYLSLIKLLDLVL